MTEIGLENISLIFSLIVQGGPEVWEHITKLVKKVETTFSLKLFSKTEKRLLQMLLEIAEVNFVHIQHD